MTERNLVLLFSIIIGLIGYAFSSRKKIRENFLPPMSFKVDRVAAPNEDFANKGNFWSVPGTYQSLVAPRSSSVQYGSQIQYNLPPENILAYKANTPFANDGLLTTGDGDIVQPVTYDRFMFSNKKSRLRTHGDPIRGDLPIVPHNSDWFRPSVQPHLDLKEGAMQVMGGFDNETNTQLSQLMSASAGSALQTFGGVSFSGDNGLSNHMGAFMRSPSAPEPINKDASLSKFMSAAPQGSNVTQGFAASGMVPSFTSTPGGMVATQNWVSVERSGDINVMRG